MASPRIEIDERVDESGDGKTSMRNLRIDRSLDRFHTLAEVGVGALSVPQANFCVPAVQSCTTTELTALAVARMAFRWNRRFSAGAGAAFGFRPISEKLNVETPDGTVSRSFSRNYFFLQTFARYYLYQGERIGFWAGGIGGIVVISDSYKTTEERKALLGPTSVALRTEGWILGGGLGIEYTIFRELAVGAWTNELVWFLPKSTHCGPSPNECTTVSGQRFSLELGLSFSYRIWLLGHNLSGMPGSLPLRCARPTCRNDL